MKMISDCKRNIVRLYEYSKPPIDILETRTVTHRYSNVKIRPDTLESRKYEKFFGLLKTDWPEYTVIFQTKSKSIWEKKYKN